MQLTGDQQKIAAVVKTYKKLFPDEYAAVTKQIAEGKEALDDPKFGQLRKDEQSDFLDRKLHEIPATLYTMLETRLEPDEFQYYDSKKGARWFANHYPEFCTPEKV